MFDYNRLCLIVVDYLAIMKLAVQDRLIKYYLFCKLLKYKMYLHLGASPSVVPVRWSHIVQLIRLL